MWFFKGKFGSYGILRLRDIFVIVFAYRLSPKKKLTNRSTIHKKCKSPKDKPIGELNIWTDNKSIINDKTNLTLIQDLVRVSTQQVLF